MYSTSIPSGINDTLGVESPSHAVIYSEDTNLSSLVFIVSISVSVTKFDTSGITSKAKSLAGIPSIGFVYLASTISYTALALGYCVSVEELDREVTLLATFSQVLQPYKCPCQ